MRPYEQRQECGICQKPLRSTRWGRQKRYCSEECRLKGLRGRTSPAWKGGVIKNRGYLQVRCPLEFSPMANHDGLVLQHRLVMARHLGRCLHPWEVVHHKNNIKDDNRLENLELLPSQTSHVSIIRLNARVESLERRVDELEKEKRLLRWQIKEMQSKRIKNGSPSL